MRPCKTPRINAWSRGFFATAFKRSCASGGNAATCVAIAGSTCGAAEDEAENLDRHDEDDLYRQIRRRVSVSGAIDVEYEDDLRVGGSSNATEIPPTVMSVLEKARVPARVMARLSPENASQLSHRIISRYKSGRCTYRQEACLRKFGYGPEETEVMSIADAKLAIDAIAANGWRRPQHLESIV